MAAILSQPQSVKIKKTNGMKRQWLIMIGPGQHLCDIVNTYYILHQVTPFYV